ncbi:MAG: N-succinylarginine dihydrolase [Tepidisphaerales bacterium]
MPLHPEINFDGLVGPTHGFGGLSLGNLASTQNRASVSNPRAAALQGLAKMRLVASLGVPQAVLPPHDRPVLDVLRRLGFTGTDERVLSKAWAADPALVVVCSSASAMWAANSATVCPSADSTDGKLHITPANLAYQFHRSLETQQTARVLRRIFADETLFVHHDALPSHASLGDEGAANHVRLGLDGPGYQIFVCGDSSTNQPTVFPARQRKRASLAVIRLNRVDPNRCVVLRQNPEAIDAGAFHNDVLCVGSADVLLVHARAYRKPASELLAELGGWLTILEVGEEELSLPEAIATYLFNSQLVPVSSAGEGGELDELAMICPTEVRDHPTARAAAERLVSAGTRLKHLHFVELNESMRNGGGPACLRLRVPVTADELAAIHPGVRLTDVLFERLTAWVEKHYRTELRLPDLADPALLRESRDALDELTRILDLGPIYDFQR